MGSRSGFPLRVDDLRLKIHLVDDLMLGCWGAMLTERLTAIFVRPPLRPRLEAEVGPWTSLSTFGEIAAPIPDDLSR